MDILTAFDLAPDLTRHGPKARRIYPLAQKIIQSRPCWVSKKKIPKGASFDQSYTPPSANPQASPGPSQAWPGLAQAGWAQACPGRARLAWPGPSPARPGPARPSLAWLGGFKKGGYTSGRFMEAARASDFTLQLIRIGAYHFIRLLFSKPTSAM